MQLYSKTGKITISQSESVKLKLIVYQNKAVYQPKASDKFILTVRTSPSRNSKAVISLNVLGNPQDSFVEFIIGSALSQTLSAGRYYYDIWLEREGARFPLTEVCVFDCKASLVERSDSV